MLSKGIYKFKPTVNRILIYTITDRLGNVYDISELLRDEMYHGIRDVDGNPLTYDDIKISGNISVLTKKDSNVVTEVIVFDDIKYEGEYTNYYPSKDEYKIGDRVFKLSRIYSLLNNNKIPHELGSNILVYLDLQGRIIDAETSAVEYKYAWIVGMAKETFENMKIKMFTQDDKMMVYEAAKKIKYNGYRIEASQLMSKNEIYRDGRFASSLLSIK